MTATTFDWNQFQPVRRKEQAKEQARVEKVEKPEQPSNSNFNWDQFQKANPEQKPKSDLVEGGKQFLKGAAVGGIGTYGDILDLLGLQAKEILPGEKAQYQREAMASPEELPNIVEADDVLPRYSRLPSSSEANQLIEKAGGPGKAQGAGQKFLERAGKFFGGSIAMGNPTLRGPIVAGAVGQGLEELGAPAWAQAAGEIIAFIGSKPKRVQVSSKSPEIKNTLSKLRKMGYTEEDLTLAKNALEERGFLKKISKLTPQAEKRFNETLSASETKVHEILNHSFPGLEEGLSTVKEASSDLFSALDDAAKNVIIEKPQSFVKQATHSIEELKKSLANTPQEKQVIGILEEAMKTAEDAKTADHFVNFYQGLNQIGNWSSPKQREYVFSRVKDAIKQTFKDQGPEGQKLGRLFEEANESWKRFRRAEDVHGIIQKSVTDEGINFGRLSKLLENPDNYKTLKEGLGADPAANLKMIAKTGESIKDFEKTMRGGAVKELVGSGKLWLLLKSIATFDMGSLKTLIGTEAASRLATKLLTEPKYQNFQMQLLQAIKKSKWDQVRAITTGIQKQMEKDGLFKNEFNET